MSEEQQLFEKHRKQYLNDIQKLTDALVATRFSDFGVIGAKTGMASLSAFANVSWFKLWSDISVVKMNVEVVIPSGTSV